MVFLISRKSWTLGIWASGVSQKHSRFAGSGLVFSSGKTPTRFFQHTTRPIGINLLACLLLLAMFFLGLFSMKDDTAIRDEMPHLVSGYSYLIYQDYRLNPEHPPLIKILAAVPLLFIRPNFPEDHPDWTNQVNAQWSLGEIFLYKLRNNPDQLLFWSRLPLLFLACLLGFFIFKWTKELFGSKAALLALFLYSFCPNILAHSRFVTTDLGVTAFFFISVYFFVKWIKDPSWKNLMVAGITLGLAQLTKFTAFVLIPYFILLVIVVLLAKKDKIKLLIPAFLLIFVIAYVLVGLVYQFCIQKMPQDIQHRLIDTSLPKEAKVSQILHTWTNYPFLRPYAQYGLGLAMVFLRYTTGHTTYFLGEVSSLGWWYFFPVALLIKTPLPVLILVFLTLGVFIRNFFKTPKVYVKEKDKLTHSVSRNFEKLVLTSLMIIFVIIGIRSRLNLGLRHILPIYPFMYVLISGQIVDFIKRQKEKIRRYLLFLLVILLLWYFGANLYIFPHYLAYFNELIGGPKNGYRYMVDSNLDWGQDLKRLNMWLEEKGIDKIKVDYFGGGDPQYYLGDKYEEWHVDYGPTTGWLAVSATYLQVSKGQEINYAWLDKHKPIVQIGYSILVYNIQTY